VTITLFGRYVDFEFVDATLKLPAALLLILIVLLVRPGGLFGRTAVRRV
jgi:branched-subunit amino acid ABC-type transport system permease component